jgi:Tol biopolymer transport system component
MTVPSPLVLEQLERMLGRQTFRSGARSATLLKFLVTETLAGRADRLKDYTLGAEGLGRGDGFDPRTDPIARVEASRLRSRLELYYVTEGAADPVVISLPKGGYVPQFQAREQTPAAPAVAEAPAGGWTSHWRLAAFGLTVAAALVSAVALRSDPEPPAEPVDYSYFPTPATFDPASLAISPDGQTLVVVGSERGIARLMLRRFTSAAREPAWEPLAGTEGASLPFWSPDSTSIGFFARSWIRRVDLATGVVRPIAKIAVPSGASWSRDNTILFPVVPDSPLFKVPADGGTPQPVTRRGDRESGHRAPFFLPDGRRFLFYVAGHPEVRGTYLGSLENGKARLLMRSDSPAMYARGHLLYVEQGTLFARPFDPVRPDPPGPARALAEGIASDESSGVAAFSVSEQGTVVYRAGTGGKRQLVRVHRSGDEVERLGEPESRGPYYPSLSPTRTRLAVQRSRNGNTDILVLDLHHAAAPVHVTEALTPEIAAVWLSPDRLVYSAPGTSTFDLFVASLAGGPPELLLSTDQAKQVTDWSPGRNVLLFRSLDPSTFVSQVWALPLGGKAFQVVRTPGDSRDAQFEPDHSRFLVYRSDRDDVPNIYLQPFPSGVPQPVSRGGGVHPRWSRDGRTIFYIDMEGWLVEVPFTAPSSGGTPTLGEPTRLFVAAIGHLQDIALPHYVVLSRDEFLLDRVVEEVPPPVTRVLNLFDGRDRSNHRGQPGDAEPR